MNPRFSVQGALSNSPLRNAAHLTTSIKGIATLSGFKSKSIFYAAFKEEYNMTPTEWMKKNL